MVFQHFEFESSRSFNLEPIMWTKRFITKLRRAIPRAWVPQTWNNLGIFGQYSTSLHPNQQIENERLLKQQDDRHFSGCGQELWEHSTLGASDQFERGIFFTQVIWVMGCYGAVWPDIWDMFSPLKLLLVEYLPILGQTHIALMKIVVNQVILAHQWCRWT